MKRLMLIMFVICFCLPAYADIIIFKTSISGQQFEVESGIVERKKENGYFIINANLSNPDSVTISEAYHLHYETWLGNKILYTTIPDDVEILMINAGKNKKMILRYFDNLTGRYMAAYGTASLKDIGNFNRYIATSLSGHDVWKLQDFITGSGSIKLRLDLKATRIANIEGKTIFEIIDEYEQLLELKGYVI